MVVTHFISLTVVAVIGLRLIEYCTTLFTSGGLSQTPLTSKPFHPLLMDNHGLKWTEQTTCRLSRRRKKSLFRQWIQFCFLGWERFGRNCKKWWTKTCRYNYIPCGDILAQRRRLLKKNQKSFERDVTDQTAIRKKSVPKKKKKSAQNRNDCFVLFHY